MCLDPQALAKIRARECLDRLGVLVAGLEANDAKVSKAAMLRELVRLRRLLNNANGSFSRQYSQVLLDLVIRGICEVIIRIVGTSFCLSPRALVPIFKYDIWWRDQVPATVEGDVAGGPGEHPRNNPLLPLAA